MSRFVDNLDRIMAERGITRKELARRAEISLGTVNAWWLTTPSRPKAVDRVAEALGVTPVELVGRDALLASSRGGVRLAAIDAVRAGMPLSEAAERYGLGEKALARWVRQAKARPRPVTPAPKRAVAEWLEAEMRAPSWRAPRCLVCGATGHLEQHHVVRRSQGGKDGPTLTLCGHGNVDGCHGRAHAGLLHFRWVEVRPSCFGLALGSGGHWECLETDEPVGDFEAREMPGWRRMG